MSRDRTTPEYREKERLRRKRRRETVPDERAKERQSTAEWRARQKAKDPEGYARAHRERRRSFATDGRPNVRIVEPDAPYHGSLMAIGLVPGRKEVLRRYVSSLPLLR